MLEGLFQFLDKTFGEVSATSDFLDYDTDTSFFLAMSP